MKKYLTLLLISILSLGLLSCSQSKDKSMTSADKKSLSVNVDTTDESGLSFEPSKDTSKTSEEKARQEPDKQSTSGNLDKTDEKGW